MAEATVLATIRQEIDKAVKKRERYKNLVNGKKEILNSLKEKINDCIRKVSTTSFENKSLYVDKLRATVEKIDKILEDAAPLINRFNRDTINLGVAGATQVGKSTFLETLSGVKLPRAKEDDKEHGGDSTTAAKSIIINSPETKVTVNFRTKEEFVKNVQAYLPEKDKGKVSDVADFERLPLDEIMSATEKANERTELKRLIEAQDAFEHIRGFLGHSPIEIDVEDIVDYVTYYQNKDVKHRFWPVVKLVEIRCPFIALGDSDIKLTLVDLPGMGESPRVSQQMVDELENEVDTVLLFFRSDAAMNSEEHNDTFERIKGAQKFVTDKTKFLSFLINVRKEDTNPEGHIKTIMTRIHDIFQHNTNEIYQVYKTVVFDMDKVHQDVVSVLSKLVDDIEDLDSDTIDGWLKSINFDEISDLLNSAFASFANSIPRTNSEHTLLNTEVKKITKAIEVNFAKLQDSYNYKIVNDDGEMTKAKENYKKVKSRIKEKVFEINRYISDHPLGYEKNEDLEAWDKEAIENVEGTHQAEFKEDQINRLRTYIRRKYNEIQFVATELYDELIDEIIEKFNLSLDATEPFIKQKGRNGVNELLSTLRSILEDYDNSFIKIAFESLTDEKVSLHQIGFKYIFDTNYALIMSTKGQSGGISEEYFSPISGLTDEEVAKSIKNGLITMVRDVNGKIAEAIGNNCTEPIMSFLYSKIEYFVDSLVRTQLNIDLVNNYADFVSPFRMQLWPDTFGSSNEAKVAREIFNELREIINNINNI